MKRSRLATSTNRRASDRRCPRAVRRGFNIIELLIALAISAMLLTATMVALDASYKAYQHTTRAASTHTISRLTLDRILTLIRTGVEFEPRPVNPIDSIVHSDYIDIITPNGQGVSVEWVAASEALYIHVFDPNTGNTLSSNLLLEGVVNQIDPVTGQPVPPFTLEFERGRLLYRATIDLMIVPDDNQSVTIEGDRPYVIRLVGSAIPRRNAFKPLEY